MTKKEIKERDLEERKEKLREILKEGDTIYTSLAHVSRSGMYRVINLYVILIDERDGRPYPFCIDYLVAPLLEGYDSKHGGCKAGGSGMDIGFGLVYTLSRKLFGDTKDKDGGYLLKQRWL